MYHNDLVSIAITIFFNHSVAQINETHISFNILSIELSIVHILLKAISISISIKQLAYIEGEALLSTGNQRWNIHRCTSYILYSYS